MPSRWKRRLGVRRASACTPQGHDWTEQVHHVWCMRLSSLRLELMDAMHVGQSRSSAHTTLSAMSRRDPMLPNHGGRSLTVAAWVQPAAINH